MFFHFSFFPRYTYSTHVLVSCTIINDDDVLTLLIFQKPLNMSYRCSRCELLLLLSSRRRRRELRTAKATAIINHRAQTFSLFPQNWVIKSCEIYTYNVYTRTNDESILQLLLPALAALCSCVTAVISHRDLVLYVRTYSSNILIENKRARTQKLYYTLK